MSVVDASELRKTFGARTVLGGCTLTIRSQERVGLVGNNGSGKSTLGRILAGLEEPDSGSVSTRRGASVAYLAQEPVFPSERTIAEVVLESLEGWSRARERHEAATESIEHARDTVERAVAEQAQAAEELERLGGWERMHEAEAILGHLGLEDPERGIEGLSGGERRRVGLARILVGAPDLAILDEPTNHLDVATIEWLEDFVLNRFPGALLLITHDREFLDRVTLRTLELHAGQLESYDGGYARYLEAKAEREAHAERTERNRQNFLRREVEWLRRQPKARATKQKARIGRARDALESEAPQQERTASLRVAAERQGKQILEVSGLGLERDGNVLLESFDLGLRAGQRVGVIGPNGIGKTSLFLALRGELPLSAGEVTLGGNTKIGYLDQSRGLLDEEQTVRQAVGGERSEIEVAGETLGVGAYLERFLFDRRAGRVRVSELSGGERARVCLAKLLSEPSNLLLLDEPTNDLDVATLGALEAMLVDYGGSVMVVSHDRWFLDRVANSILAFEGDGRAELHPGNYSDYHERIATRAAGAEVATAVSRKEKTSREKKSAKPKKLSFKEERELEGLIERIEAAEAESARLEGELADPETYQREGSEIASLRAAFQASRVEIDTLTARWEELEAQRDPGSG